MENISKSVIEQLGKLQTIIQELGDDMYTRHIPIMYDASVGMHARHIIEMYLCLLKAVKLQVPVDYDARDRDVKIETDPAFASEQISMICQKISKTNFEESLEVVCHNMRVPSNYQRELLYQIEHSIHHMALIKTGLRSLDIIIEDETFGVAPSTITHKQTCAQ